MAMTGHKSVDMVRRYIKEADLFKNNALNKIKIKKILIVINKILILRKFILYFAIKVKYFE